MEEEHAYVIGENTLEGSFPTKMRVALASKVDL